MATSCLPLLLLSANLWVSTSPDSLLVCPVTFVKKRGSFGTYQKSLSPRTRLTNRSYWDWLSDSDLTLLPPHPFSPSSFYPSSYNVIRFILLYYETKDQYCHSAFWEEGHLLFVFWPVLTTQLTKTCNSLSFGSMFNAPFRFVSRTSIVTVGQTALCSSTLGLSHRVNNLIFQSLTSKLDDFTDR